MQIPAQNSKRNLKEGEGGIEIKRDEKGREKREGIEREKREEMEREKRESRRQKKRETKQSTGEISTASHTYYVSNLDGCYVKASKSRVKARDMSTALRTMLAVNPSSRQERGELVAISNPEVMPGLWGIPKT